MQGEHLSATTGGVELRLFGCFDLRVGETSVEVGRREQRLLAFLALRGRRSRSYVAGTLWPETSESRALTSLRTALLRSRRAVAGALDVGRTTLALAPGLTTDVDDLLRCTAEIERGSRRNVREALALLSAADLLPGWYEDWVLFEKERLEHLRIRTLERLAELELADGHVDLALLAAREAVTLEPLRESAHALAIKAQLMAGNRAAAVGAYDAYRRRLHRELGIGPSSDLVQLVRCGAAVPAQRSGGPARAAGSG